MKELFEKLVVLDIPETLLHEANLQESDWENVYRRIKILHPHLKISQYWQLQLLTGSKEFFIEHFDKQDDENNLLYYAMCSESFDAMQWIYNTHFDLFNEYDQMKFVEDFSGITFLLKGDLLFTWISKHGNVSNLNQEVAETILVNLGLAGWIEGLDTLKKIQPEMIEKYGSILIYLSIMNKKVALFEWVKLNLHDALMTLEYFEAAVKYGFLAAVHWFIEFAPPEMLNYTDAHGVNILHLAAISKSTCVFDAILEKKKELLLVPDNQGLFVTEYALNSKKPNKLNKVLQLTNRTTLNLVHTPKKFNTVKPDGDFIVRAKGIEDLLAHMANQILDINFNIQKIDCGNHVLPEEADSKIQRNISITQIEKVKPVIIFWLFLFSELDLPMDIMLKISQMILPNDIPKETFDCYSKHFFFINKNSQEITPIVTDEDELQKEIEGPNLELLYTATHPCWK